MKTNLALVRHATVLLLLPTLNPQLSTFAQGTAFTYQGRLNHNGSGYTGDAEFQPTLWNIASGGMAVATNTPLTVTVSVSNGLFVLPLNFGAAFPGADRWLQLEVRTTLGPFTTLTPRQRIAPAPYAITASNLTGTLPVTQLSGQLTGAQIANGAVNAAKVDSTQVQLRITGTAPVGAFLTGIAANGSISVGADTSDWKLGGTAGTTPGTHFLGTTDNQPLEIKVNGRRALRIEPTTNSGFGYSPNIVGGFSGNIISNGFLGAVIGGGYPSSPNRVGNDFATIVGGAGNTASGSASTAMGQDTTASGGVSTAMGYRAQALHQNTFVWADASAEHFASTGDNQFCLRASGGVQLSGGTSIFFGTTARQMLNLLGTDHAIGVQSGTTYFRTSAGGAAFAWYAGGVHHNDAYNPGAGGAPLMTLNGGALTVNGTFVSGSDRNVKENFAPVQPRAVLEKVIALPLSSWNYKADPATRHLGPMAQDFYAAFNVGPDDKHIATVDADGVALAAIQGLNQKVEQREAALREELKRRDAENAELKEELHELKRLVGSLVQNGGQQ